MHAMIRTQGRRDGLLRGLGRPAAAAILLALAALLAWPETARAQNATGLPIIVGTTKVGDTLTADTFGISDTDGPASPSFSYEWLAAGTVISGATSQTYTIQMAQLGQQLAVRVSFTDGAGNLETLTSQSTVAVDQRPTGRPHMINLGAGTVREPRVGDLLANLLDSFYLPIEDPDGPGNLAWAREHYQSYWWLADDVPVYNAQAYSLTAAEVGKRMKLRFTFTDGAGVVETVDSELSGTVRWRLAAFGEPTITGIYRVGDTLTADYSEIIDLDGYDTTSLTYQWFANDVAITGATSKTFTLTAAQQAKRIKVRVSFTDGAGDNETPTSAQTGAVRAAGTENEPATGTPAVSGTVRPGWTVTANTDGISDSHGLTRPRYRYQWLADGVAITGATSKTYTLAAAQQGKRISVRVTFTDDGGFAETSTSPQTEAALGGSPPEGAPDITGRSRVGDTLTAITGRISDADGVKRSTLTYQWLADGVAITGATSRTYTLAAAQEEKRISVRVTFEDDGGTTETLTSPATGKVLAPPTANQNPTGRPAISGTVKVGQTLTTNTGGIADADGLTRPRYVYQWLADDAVISGRTAKAYTVTSSEVGKLLKVRVSFTDDGGTVETLTSEATVAVPSAGASAGDIRLIDNRLLIFRDGAWGAVCEDGLTSTTERQLAEVVCRQLGHMGGEYVDELEYVRINHPIHMTNVNCTGAETRLDNCRFSTDVRCDHREDVGVRCTTETTPLVPANQAPVGLPTITGTARVGQTLTADTSEMSDPDGPEELEFTYQWLAAGNSISNATAATYTIQATDLNKSLTVQVSFTDDGGAVETLTSAGTSAVAAHVQMSSVAVTVTIRAVSPTPAAVEGGSKAVVPVDVIPAPNGAVLVPITATGSDGAGAGDFTISPTTLTFNSGDTSKNVTVTAVDDQVDDDGETVTLGFGTLPSNASIARALVTTLTVGLTDNDERGVEVSEESVTVLEGGSASYTVALDTEPTGTVTVRVTTDLSGTDVTVSPAALTFTAANWGTAQALTVSAEEDDGDTLDDPVTLTHAVSGGDYESETASSVTVTITDNDRPSVSIADASGGESAGSLRFAVSLDIPSSREVTVGYETADDTAEAGTDYTAASGTLTFAAGATGPQTITVEVTEDGVDEGEGETFTVALKSPANAVLGDASAEGNIEDDDERGVEVSEESVTVLEGGSASYTVALESEPTGAVTVRVTTDLSGTDVTVSPAALTFTAANWGTAQALTVSAEEDDGDALDDDPVTLTHAVSGGDYGGETASSVTVTITENDGPSVSIADASGGESAGSLRFAVSLDIPSSREVTVGYETADDTAEAGTDYTAASGTLTFAAGATGPQTITVEVTEDGVDEGEGETFTVALKSPANAALGDASAEGNIEDDDERGVEVSEESVTVLEGGSASYTVALESEPTGTVTVRVTTDLSGTDVTVSAAALTFTAANWGTAQALTVSAEEDDGDALDDDPVTLTHAVSGGDYGGETASSVTVTITENDGPSVSIADASGGESAGSLRFAVSLDIPSSRAVTVGYETADDTAEAGTDYTAASGTLTFAAGATGPQTITVEVTEDGVDEGEGETFTVALRSPTNAVLGDASAEGNIEDDDERGVEVSEESVTVLEGGSASYTVALESEPTGTVTVRVTTDLSGTDVTVSPAALTFTAANWGTAQALTVSAEEDDGDALDDDPVTLTHAVSGGDYGGETASSVTVTITENDGPSVSIADASGGESAGSLPFAVSLDIPSSKLVTVGYATADDTAAAGTDYTAASGTLTFAAGATGPQTITVEVTEDGVDEGEGETFTVALKSPTNVALGDASAEGNIEDDDERGVEVSEESVTVLEGGSASYTVALESEPTGTVTVRVTTDLSGTDVTVSPAALTFTAANWGTAQALTVSAEEDDGDALDDDPVTLTHAVSGGDYGGETASSVTVTITENDRPSVSIADASGGESAGSLRFAVSLDIPSSREVTVGYETADDTAAAGTDYTAASGTLTFAAGATGPQTITVEVTEDGVDEGEGETFTVALKSPANAALGDASAEGNIEDDDERGVEVSEESVTVLEGGSASYTVALESEPTGTVTVRVTTDLSGTDVTVSPAALTFTAANWGTAQALTVSAEEDDGDALDDDPVTLTHAVSGGDYGGETASSVTVTITENDGPSVSIADASGGESAGSLRFAVSLDIPSSREVTVGYETADDTAEAGTDYTAASGTLTFAAGATGPQTITVEVTEDGVDEGEGETFTVALRSPANAALGDASAEGNIEDDDERGVEVSASRVTVSEGGSASYTVALESEPTGAVTVRVTTDLSGTDVGVSPAALTFTAANWGTAQALTVSAEEDDDTTSEPEVTLSHEASGGDYGGESVAGVLVTVIENDVSVLAAADAAGVESDGVLRFEVSLSLASSDAVTVEYATANGTAAAGTDYTAASGTVTFAAGTAGTQTIEVTVTDDEVDEALEAFTLELSNAMNAQVGDASAKGSIEDDDERGVSLSEERVTVPEGGSASYMVVLASQPTADVTVTVTVPSGTDVTAAPGRLTFTAANWGTAQTVAVSAAEDDGDALDDLEVALEHAVSGGDYGGETVPGVLVAVEENDRPEVSIADAGAAEGAGVVRFAVRLNIPSSREVTVNYATADGTAEAGADYTAASGTVTFAAGETERVVEVSIADDQVDEDPADGAVAETFTVTLSGPSASAELGEAPSAEGSIEDDDERGVSLSRGRLTVTEGRSESYTVVLGSKPVAEVMVTVRVPSGAGVTVRPGRLTFTPANWSEAQRVTVSGVEDENAVAEPAVTLAHGASGGDYEDETVPGVLVTVIETDVPTLVIADASGLESAGVLGFVVSLSTATGRAVTVGYETADDTAEAGTDYTAASGTLTFAAGATGPQTITVEVTEDGVDEGEGETFTVALRSPTNAVLGDASAEGNIEDDDERGVEVSEESVTVLEGGSASYTVALESEPTGAVTVRVTTDLSGTDVTVSPAALTFTAANWGTAQALTVSAEEDDGDALDDDPVTLTHAVSGGDYGGETASSVTVTITENDGPSVSIADASGGESAGSLRFAVSLDIPSSREVTVGYETADDTAEAGTDYTAASGTLTFAAGATGPQTITVEVTEDGVDEGEGETFTVALKSPANAVLGDASAEGNIEDDDERGVEVSEESVTVLEGGSASYTVALESEPTGAVTVRVTTDLSGTDVTVSPAALTFTAANWGTAQALTVSAEEDDGDALDDDPVTLTHAVSGGDYGGETASSVTVTITENDGPSVSIADASGGESAGSLRFAVSLDIPSSREVTVGYETADDTAEAGTDYTAASGTLTFAAGATGSQTITVEVTEDGVDEGEGETFTVALRSPTNAVLGDASAEGNIEDDDERGVEVSEESVTVLEGGSASYTVALESEPTGTVTVRVTTDLSGTDVTVSPAALTFTAANWGTAQALTVSAEEDDGDALDDDPVTLTHAVSGGDYGGETASSVTVTITENDGPSVSIADASGGESAGSLRFAVSLDIPSSRAVTVGYETADDTAEAGTDYTAASGTLTFAAGATGPQTITVEVTEDGVDEGEGETFTVALRSPTNAVLGDANATGTIKDEDESVAPNTPPRVVRDIEQQGLTAGGEPAAVDVSGVFEDAEGDELTYTASSADPGVATVRVSGTTVTVVAVGAGRAQVTVTATDAEGSNTGASQSFVAVVSLAVGAVEVTPAAGGGAVVAYAGATGPAVRIEVPAGAGGSSRLDTDGDGDLDVEDNLPTVRAVTETEVPEVPTALRVRVDTGSAVDIELPEGATAGGATVRVCLATSLDGEGLTLYRYDAEAGEWQGLESTVEERGEQRFVCADVGDFSVFVVFQERGAVADVNGDGEVSGDDALVMYYVYTLGDLLEVERFRRTLLEGRAGQANPSDADLVVMVREAKAWRDAGAAAGGDVNGDGEVSGDDALVMYYVYTLGDLLEVERFRRTLLEGRAGQANPSDADLVEMVRKAKALRDAAG